MADTIGRPVIFDDLEKFRSYFEKRNAEVRADIEKLNEKL